MTITLDELVQEMNRLEDEMRPFEWKYSIKSAEFYKLVESGKLDESPDFHRWLGLYKIWRNRHILYLQGLSHLSPLLPLTEPVEAKFFETELVA